MEIQFLKLVDIIPNSWQKYQIIKSKNKLNLADFKKICLWHIALFKFEEKRRVACNIVAADHLSGLVRLKIASLYKVEIRRRLIIIIVLTQKDFFYIAMYANLKYLN